MNPIHDSASEECRTIIALHELIALELTPWIPVVTILLHRLADIDQIMDESAWTLLRQLEQFVSEERTRDPGGRDRRLVVMLSELPAWHFHVVSGREHWNPIEESLADFAERHGAITVFEAPDPWPEPAQLQVWFDGLYGQLQTQGQDALAS